MISADAVVIGGGLAGLCAALEAKYNGCADVVILSRSVCGKSGNTLVSGAGVCVYNEENLYGDSKEQYYEDIMKSGAGICDENMVARYIDETKTALKFLSNNGVQFRCADGKQVVKKPPGHSKRRSYPADFSDVPYTNRGLALTLPLLKKAKELGVSVLDNTDVIQLARDGEGRVCGAYCIAKGANSDVFLISSKAVILAAGGGAALFSVNNNTSDVGCDSFRMAYEAGARLRDMEMVQFFPCMMHKPMKINISTPLFGDGAVMRNARGEAFLGKYTQNGNLATRDIMARAAKAEIDAGRGNPDYVYVDCTGIDHDILDKQYTEIERKIRLAKIDIKKDWIPVSPAAHFYIGGIVVDEDYQTDIDGLFACGEAVGGLHGANRLSGNALSEAVVSGRIAGKAAAYYAGKIKGRAAKPIVFPNTDGKAADKKTVKDRICRTMWKNASICRSEESLQYAKSVVRECEGIIENAGWNTTDELRDYFKLKSLIVTAEMLLDCALLRKESRGAHYRVDYPNTSDEYLGNFYCKKTEEGIAVAFEKK